MGGYGRLTFILWGSSWLWLLANRLDGACWSVRRSDISQRFVGDYSPVVVLLVGFQISRRARLWLSIGLIYISAILNTMELRSA